MTIPPGTSIASSIAARVFEFDGCLGAGGFGSVYLATMVSPGSGLRIRVACKLLHREVTETTDAAIRLRDEARALSGLNHPGILAVRDLVAIDGRVALVMEYVEGQDLADVIKAGGMPPGVALEAIGHAAGALATVWSQLAMVHRDIKPSNIRISRHGHIKLLDFGISRSDSAEREARTATQHIVGTLQYMAPERFDVGSPNPKSDVFALGCTLYEAVAGRRLFDVREPAQMLGLIMRPDRMEARLDAAFRRLSEGVSPSVRELIRQMVAISPDDRPTASEVEERCHTLAREASGPNLFQWAKARSWPEIQFQEGELAGRILTEQTLAPQGRPESATQPLTAPLSAPLMASNRASYGLLAAFVAVVLGLGGLAAIGVVIGVVVGSLTGSSPADDPHAASTVEPEPAQDLAPHENLVLDVEPVAALELSPDEVVALAAAQPPPIEEAALAEAPPVSSGAETRQPAAPKTRAAAASIPDPAATPPTTLPVAPEPAPATAPVVAADLARINVDEAGLDVVVELVGDDGRHTLPTSVSPGSYEIVYTLASGTSVSLGRVQLLERETRLVKCSATMRTCSKAW